jgi:predicted NBD/HSP70 family sugar kinase
VSVTTTPAIAPPGAQVAAPPGAQVAAPPGAQVAAPPGGQAARPQLIRELNEQLLLGKIRQFGPCSRADLARLSGLSKPTVSLAMSNVERSGLIRTAGHRTGVPGRSARLYEIRPDAGFVLGLDIGQQYLRGALADLSGEVRARQSVRSRASSVSSRIAELVGLSDGLCAEVGVARAAITQTVIGSPGVYNPRLGKLTITGGLSGWGKPEVLSGLRDSFGPHLVVENDADAAALAEQALGHGRGVDSFAFVTVGTGIGMGLVLNGRLHRGFHGVAGEIAYLPISEGTGTDEGDARRRGVLEAAGSAAGVVRAARRAGLRGPVSARRVFAAAAAGDARAAAVVADEARLVAKAICAVVTVVDPQLVVLGGGIGQAPGFADMVHAELRGMAPVVPDIRVSARGTDAVVDGCMAAATDLAWQRLLAALPGLPPDGAAPDGAAPAGPVPASPVPASPVPASADG